MTTQLINDAYPLSAIFIDACGITVDKEKIGALFKVLGIEYQPKLGELFSLPADQFDNLLSCVGSAPVAAEQVEEKKEVAAEKAEEKQAAPEEDVDIDLDDMFG